RNATDAKLTDIGADQLLVVRTVGSDPNAVSWKCMAWYFSASAGTLRTTTTASDAVAVGVPASEPTTWTLLASGIAAPGSGAIFCPVVNRVSVYVVATTHGSGPLDISSSSGLWAGAIELSQSCFYSCRGNSTSPNADWARPASPSSGCCSSHLGSP